MEIKLGTVRSNIDLFRSGRMIVAWEDHPMGVEIKYTSPYVNFYNIVFMSVPEVGTNVLICKPLNSNDW